jgi:peptidoglycan hydrolase CwlO-like protein
MYIESLEQLVAKKKEFESDLRSLTTQIKLKEMYISNVQEEIDKRLKDMKPALDGDHTVESILKAAKAFMGYE